MGLIVSRAVREPDPTPETTQRLYETLDRASAIVRADPGRFDHIRANWGWVRREVGDGE
jgi:hypothetical protein